MIGPIRSGLESIQQGLQSIAGKASEAVKTAGRIFKSITAPSSGTEKKVSDLAVKSFDSSVRANEIKEAIKQHRMSMVLLQTSHSSRDFKTHIDEQSHHQAFMEHSVKVAQLSKQLKALGHSESSDSKEQKIADLKEQKSSIESQVRRLREHPPSKQLEGSIRYQEQKLINIQKQINELEGDKAEEHYDLPEVGKQPKTESEVKPQAKQESIKSFQQSMFEDDF